jgi:hypothetical protein
MTSLTRCSTPNGATGGSVSRSGRTAGGAGVSATVLFVMEPAPRLVLTLAAMVGHPRQTTVEVRRDERSGHSWGAAPLGRYWAAALLVVCDERFGHRGHDGEAGTAGPSRDRRLHRQGRDRPCWNGLWAGGMTAGPYVAACGTGWAENDRPVAPGPPWNSSDGW